jgi:hypothetical protein
LNELLYNKSALLTRPSHGVNWERHENSCLTTHSPLLYPHPTPGYAAPKSGSSFCRILYLNNTMNIIRPLYSVNFFHSPLSSSYVDTHTYFIHHRVIFWVLHRVKKVKIVLLS